MLPTSASHLRNTSLATPTNTLSLPSHSILSSPLNTTRAYLRPCRVSYSNAIPRLASQQGEAEADMALSKWFLCGADGAFEKDEGLAVTFADKVRAHLSLWVCGADGV